MTEATKAEPANLKQRLAGLTPSQRAALARQLMQESAASGMSSATAIPKCAPLRVTENSGAAVYPASFSQQRMWFLHHYAGQSPVYNMPSAFHLNGPLNTGWLASAIRNVIQRHDVLRTTLASENGELFQFVSPDSSFRLTEIDLESIPAAERLAALEQCLRDEARKIFDLVREPPFRAALVRLQPNEHVLLVVFHHVNSDGWSRSIYYRELAAAYSALAADTTPALPALPVQFADFSAWQKKWLTDGVRQVQAAHWKTKLAGDLPPLDLPADRMRPAVESFQGGRCTLALAPELIARLKARAQEEGATLFMILLAAFKTLLCRYTDQEDLSVGVPIANRHHTELEGLLGYFANTLVMRTPLRAGLTFRELLRRVRETAVEAYSHQDLPFEQLVGMLQVKRDASRTPLFQVSFAMQDYPAVELTLSNVQATPFFVSTRTSKFDLSLTLERSGEGWIAATEHSTDLFDRDRMERLLGHWRVILESVADNPDQCLAEIPLLTPGEKRQILEDWNRTGRDYPPIQSIHELFEQQARRTPDAMAVEFEGNSMTYRELDARANQLAMQLRALGAGPDVPVGLCMERSPGLVAALLGILKAGGAYVPLDPKYPKERIDFIVRDSGASVVVTQRDLGFDFGAARRVYLDDEATSATDTLMPAATAVTPSNLAYIIYTSGSTGRPKGVAIEHRNVISLLHWMRETFSDLELSRLLASTSVCFDISVFEIFGPLSWGGCVVLVNNLLDLASARAPRNISMINTVPSVLVELFRGHTLPPSIRTVCLGGEALRQPVVETAFKKSSATQVNDLYGPTETTVYSTRSRRTAGGMENIGGPIANTQLYILDARGQPLPVGIQGELCIGGAGVARGYWRRPELTAERFVPNRFTGKPGDRFFKTGDRARWLVDGTVVLLGRADGQVKLRGFRIELGEIESALRSLTEVREAAALLRDDSPNGPWLVAYLVSQAEKKPDMTSLRSRLAAVLPEYMVPNAFVWLDRLPTTPNGKVDRKALPAPKTGTPSEPGEAAQPVTVLEMELTRIWERLFQRNNISRNDNFFDLGGHSLLALRLTTEIEKLAARQIPIAALFQAPTIASLARKLEDEKWVPVRTSLVPLQPQGSELPVFFIHGIYGDVYVFIELAHELAPDRPVYGLQAVGLDGRQPRHKTVQEMAAHYVREIRSVQPHGPYHLAGLSLGGWIAYAVAQELVSTGNKVALLALIDTRATANVPWPIYARFMMPHLAGRMWFHAKNSLQIQKGGRRRYVKEKLTSLRIWLTRARGNFQSPPQPTKSSPDASTGFAIDYFDSVAARYRPETYPGDVTVFTGVDGKFFHHFVFWNLFVAGRVQVISVAGNHRTLIDKTHSAEFTKTFRQALHQAEADAGLIPAGK